MERMSSRRIYSFILAAVTAVIVTTVPSSSIALAAPANSGCNDTLLTFPAWFKGLTDGDCNIKSPKAAGGLPVFIWTIVLNIIQVGLQLVGYISVGFIIRGGFKYMTAVGSSGEIAKAKSIITNAVVGLAISMVSVAIVNFVAGALKP